KELVKGDIITVSGLARGIDTAVHEATLEFGGKTVAVLGTPLDRFYPPENAELQKRLMSEQMVISQFPVGHKTSPKDFVIRNRTMALISDATIVVEARERSGTVSQGWEAIRLGRPLYISQPLVEAGLSWVKSMQWYGARVLRDVDQVIEEISFPMERPL
ncbi:MAG TPA: DNA-processing protein DprA, partial [Thermoprotei archaeon]|nr:DNA-processing protein DprA [Thermoprotei archaeon]